MKKIDFEAWANRCDAIPGSICVINGIDKCAPENCRQWNELPDAPQWISVNDRSPVESGRYPVWRNGEYDTEYCYNQVWDWDSGITHWLDVKPPEVEK